jgi:Protein tyrosine and serine/threonine kinase
MPRSTHESDEDRSSSNDDDSSGGDSDESKTDSRDDDASSLERQTASSSDEESRQRPEFHGLMIPSRLRRRGGARSAENRNSSSPNNQDENRKKHRWRRSDDESTRVSRRVARLRIYRQRCPQIFDFFMNWLLFLSFAIFLYYAAFISRPSNPDKMNGLRPAATLRERTHMRTKDEATTRHGSPIENFIQDATKGFWNLVNNNTAKHEQVKKKRKDAEVLLPGCVRANWQELSFPTCNDIHDVDLETVFRRQNGVSDDGEEAPIIGFLNAGLWRDVWSVRPRATMIESVVMKTMKAEHDYDHRNFDRHRRDALAMERLTSSPHIVDIYGFCGNTVLTQYIPKSLRSIIEDDLDELGVESSNESGIQARDESYPTRKTQRGRIRLALEVAQGLKALHEVPGGPIVHADIDSRQFLITNDGVVKLNDFNRCRFMTHDKYSRLPCPFRIPTAPGKSRSPEEYLFEDLDEKLDVYAAANVYYTILTGRFPWDSWSGSETKNYVKNGVKPAIPEGCLQPGTLDAVLANLTLQAYALDPRKRINASELVAALEHLL